MTVAEQKKEKISGAAATLLFHGLLLLLFILLKLPSAEIGEGTEESSEGITIDFGNTDAGMGETETLQANQTTTETSSQQSAATSQTDENVITQNSEEAPAVSVKTKTQEEVIQPQPDQNLLSAINKIKNSSGGNSGQGHSDTPGNEGELDGTDGGLSKGNNPEGTWELKEKGRKMIGKIEIEYDSQETGIVAVEISVDKYGKVIRATPVLMGSTTTNLYLWSQAKKALQDKILYNVSPSGKEVRGTIYFNFTLR